MQETEENIKNRNWYIPWEKPLFLLKKKDRMLWKEALREKF